MRRVALHRDSLATSRPSPAITEGRSSRTWPLWVTPTWKKKRREAVPVFLVVAIAQCILVWEWSI